MTREKQIWHLGYRHGVYDQNRNLPLTVNQDFGKLYERAYEKGYEDAKTRSWYVASLERSDPTTCVYDKIKHWYSDSDWQDKQENALVFQTQEAAREVCDNLMSGRGTFGVVWKVKTAVQVALETANERKKQELAKKENEKAEARALDKKRKILVEGVDKALAEFNSVPGVKVVDNVITVNGREITVNVEYTTGTWRPSDESPEQDYRAYVIRWRDRYDNQCYASSTVEEFNNSFGKFISRYL